MRTLFILTFLTGRFLILQAQITLEHSYAGANQGTNGDFGIVRLDSSTFMFCRIDYTTSSFTLYNLNHSVFQNVTIPISPANNLYNIRNITRTLFDCDTSNIEYLVSYHDFSASPNVVYAVKIFRTNGTLIFDQDSSRLYSCGACSDQAENYIVNTPAGAKMILYHQSGSANVFALCGSLPASIQTVDTLLGLPFPNPARETVSLPYSLPGNEKSGILTVNDANGKVIRSYIVDGTFHNLVLSTADLPAGMYYYQLITSNGPAGTRRVVKIH